MPIASALNVVEFARARFGELEVLQAALEPTTEARHLRRRARSHAAVNWTTPSAKKQHEPLRRDRRRRAKLIDERSLHRPQVDNGKSQLLETHMWQAKRMRMVEQDGCVVALRRSDRGLRAAYRSAVGGCVLRDVSNVRAVELRVACLGLSVEALEELRATRRASDGTFLVVQSKECCWLWAPPTLLEALRRDTAAQDVALNRFELRGPKSTEILAKALNRKIDEHSQVIELLCNDPRTTAPHVEEQGDIWSASRREASTAAVLALRDHETHAESCPKLKVDVLIVRRRCSSALQDGWDLVLPAGWAMPFWLGLVMKGAHVIGSLEAATLRAVECGLPSFPEDFPDSADKRIVVLRQLTAVEANPTEGALVCVRVVCIAKGLPTPGSIILPPSSDEEGAPRLLLEQRAIGKVTSGGFSHATGRGAGIGHVDARAWASLQPPNGGPTAAVLYEPKSPIARHVLIEPVFS